MQDFRGHNETDWYFGWKLVWLCLALFSSSCKQEKEAEREDVDLKVEELVASEEWIEFMGGKLNALSPEISSLPTDAPSFTEIFQDGEIAITSCLVQGFPTSDQAPAGLVVEEYLFEETSSEIKSRGWDFLSEEINELRNGKFGFLRGAFTDDSRRTFVASVIFSAEGKLGSGRTASLDSLQEITWDLQEGGEVPAPSNDYSIDPNEWRIADWRFKEAKVTTAPRPLFSEVTEEVIPDKYDLKLVESTDHSRYLDLLFRGEQIPLKSGYGQYFTTDATAQHPALSVVDINGDGRDDLYVCVRWGRNLLFRDKGDGSFEEVAKEYGLDLDGLSAAAIFADFDNDGDQDVFVGRSLERSVYLINEGGYFLDSSTTHVSSPLPYLTTSLAAADYNNDGLLDIYFSTYGFAIRQPRDQVAKDFLGDYDPEEVRSRFVSPFDVEPYLNLPGPPNVLLLNKGSGMFEVSPLSKQLASWRETLQATWADIDQDGDLDLYVCNDFAPDVLYRNEDGQSFTDVTSEIGHERMRGFGMGASFGDFDNDSDLDLYVSNMFSKAGLRIIDQVGMEDERFRWSAEGNLLFGNVEGKGFAFVSEEGSSLAPVAKADWSWGGQFCDFDNDGFLDLYVPNGYFTAPREFAGDADL